MQIQQLFGRIKDDGGIKDSEIYEEVLNWCTENLEKMDLDSKEQRFLYDAAITWMINDKYDNLNIGDANVLIQYLAKDYLHSQGISDTVRNISIITD